ncbi:hypothetical protein RJ640_021712 [Escallonia rubra]|uniref:Phospholipid/glycerol acyltransferase domain-containing protein n=1 Tax=Escallonia rubra TaxID=112253 RepID=A0AA88U1B8_9ASTE|nr:hypothetical protein RJ640_021712 [Escallonia rubra]
MASTAFCLAKLVFTVFRVLLKQYYRIPKGLHRNFSNAHASHGQFQKSHSLAQRSDLSDHTLIFNVEGALLKSSSTFPYFMLVAFEAGSIIRAFFLFILYPFLCLLSQEVSLKITVMVCFFGIKKESFRVGTAVLPKFFLEDVGAEGFEVLRKGGRKVGVSDLPRVMVESFLKDYLEIDFVVGRELKVCCGYYVGLMEEKTSIEDHSEEIFDQDEKMCCDLIGVSSSNKSEIYLVNEEDKSKWHLFARDRYPKPLIFHDGRLAFRPTLLNMLAMFMWFPVGSILSITRVIVAISLPYNASIPILSFTGVQLKLSKPNYFHSSISKPKPINKHKGLLYVCNHRTLLDPVFLSFGLKKPFAAVTYSLSRMSELLSPIRTVRLTRDRDQDAKMIDSLLNQGDLVVCPEGTTCREPYLLRFSPLFSELSDEIVPVGMDTRVSMFHGTTAGGLKFLDPFFFLMNPCPAYIVRFLDMVHGASRCRSGGATSSFEVANYVQRELGKALGFECTKLTRRDKYLILAGNEGIASGTGNR